MKATQKQVNLLKLMINDLDTEFDKGTLKDINLDIITTKQASELIGLNKDLYFLCVNEGQCTPKNYNTLVLIYGGRKPKLPRKYLVNWQVEKFINDRRVAK